MGDILLEDRLAVQDLLTEFAWRVDHGAADRVADLFTEDAVIETPMFKLDGRAAIAKQFGERAKDTSRVSRHIWTNLRLTRQDDGSLLAQSGAQTYMANGDAPLAPADRVVGDSIDVVVKDADGVWRFASRRLVIAFKGGVPS